MYGKLLVLPASLAFEHVSAVRMALQAWHHVVQNSLTGTHCHFNT
jgi:hypothetical protein